jgi:hypothetical protein
MNYKEYLETEHWKELSEKTKELAGNLCQLCNSDGELHAHHRTYDRLGEELPGDLICLCSDCHKKFHNKEEADNLFIGMSDKEKRARTKNMIMVNGKPGAVKVVRDTYDDPSMKVIGVSPRAMCRNIYKHSQEYNIIVVVDPDTPEKDIVEASRHTGTRMLRLSDKVDDYILEHDLDKEWLRSVIRQARYV